MKCSISSLLSALDPY